MRQDRYGIAAFDVVLFGPESTADFRFDTKNTKEIAVHLVRQYGLRRFSRTLSKGDQDVRIRCKTIERAAVLAEIFDIRP